MIFDLIMDEEGKDNFNFSKMRLPLALTIVGLTLLAAGIYFTLHKSEENSIKFTQENTASASATIFVDVSGEIEKPGLYVLPVGSRVNDVIQKAGGFTDQASQEYISKTLNLALIVKDGAKIYIPKTQELITNNVAGVAQKAVGSLININTASLSELDQLSDIGQARAQKIVENRPYSTIDELVEKKIISPSIFEKIKEKISVY